MPPHSPMNGTTDKSGATRAEPRLPVLLIAYYAGLLAAMGIAACFITQQRVRDGWHLESMGSVSPLLPGERWFQFDPFVLLIPMLGAMGGCLHGLASLGAHAGKKDLESNWWPFYCALPLLGGGVALIVYIVLHGGITGLRVGTERGAEFIYAAWAALAGLFSPVAMQKLRDVFEALFNKSQPTPSEKAREQTKGPQPAMPERTQS